MRSLQRLLLVFVCTFILAPSLQAKELAQRLGVGYSNQFSSDLPSINLRYFPSTRFGLSAALGLDTQEDASKFGFMVKLYRNIFLEENLNFYMGTGAGLVSEETVDSGTGKSENSSGFQLNAFVGCEFFFAGLENLSLSFETGIGVTSMSEETRFKTIGDSPIHAGITFYF